jgi:phosphate-selective porin OprO/OprP
MKCFLKLGRKVILNALTVTMVLGAFMVFMSVSVCAAEKSVTEQILDILLKNHEISQAQYDALLKQADAEKMAEAQKIVDAQKAAEAKIAALPAVEKKPTDFRAWFNKADGLHFTTEDKAFDMHIGGRIQADFADAEPDPALVTWANGIVKGVPGAAFSSKHGTSAPTAVDGYGDQLRRVRLDIDGTLWNNIEFIMQPDFAPSYKVTTAVNRTPPTGATTATLTTGAAITFADVWVGVKDIPLIGRIRVGQMYEPLSIEQMTSDNWNTFMEKALPVNAFIPGRQTGFETQNTACNDRIGWMAGYFFQQQAALSSNGVPLDTTGDLFSPHLDATQFAARLYGLPWYEKDGEHLLHIGVGYSHEFRSDTVSTISGPGFYNAGTLDFKSSPEANLFSPLVDSGYFLAKGVDILDPEIALVYGPFSMQAEYIYASASDVVNYQSGSPFTYTLGKGKKAKTIDYSPTANFDGWYAQASVFLTGEHRSYAKTASPATYQATFGRIIPNHNFNPLTGGTGAWELAFRVSQLDDNDTGAGFYGGMETDYTVGINWYLNPNVMVKMDYVHVEIGAHSTGVGTNNYYGNMPTSGSDDIVETRFQIAF